MSFDSLKKAIDMNKEIIKRSRSPHERDIARLRLRIIRKHKKELYHGKEQSLCRQ